jgi:hypothetical protein
MIFAVISPYCKSVRQLSCKSCKSMFVSPGVSTGVGYASLLMCRCVSMGPADEVMALALVHCLPLHSKCRWPDCLDGAACFSFNATPKRTVIKYDFMRVLQSRLLDNCVWYGSIGYDDMESLGGGFLLHVAHLFVRCLGRGCIRGFQTIERANSGRTGSIGWDRRILLRGWPRILSALPAP